MLNGVDAILGMDWLKHHGMSLDCGRNECTFSVKGQKRALRPSRSNPQMPQVSSISDAFNESFIAAKGTPLLSAGQAAQAIKKGATNWLMVVQSDDDIASISPSVVTAAATGASQALNKIRALNKITVRDRFPLPLINDLLDSLHGCTVFSSLDLHSGYSQSRIRDEDKEETAMALLEISGAHWGRDGISVDPEKLPLLKITSAAATFNWLHWGPAEKRAFEDIKHALTHAPVLAIPDLSAPFQVYTDASMSGDRSAKYSSAKFNCITGEQELLALYHALKAWRCYLEGSTETDLLTDHHPLISCRHSHFCLAARLVG
eukprot:1157662-Pelagomonas_calceolata.AAC.4